MRRGCWPSGLPRSRPRRPSSPARRSPTPRWPWRCCWESRRPRKGSPGGTHSHSGVPGHAEPSPGGPSGMAGWSWPSPARHSPPGSGVALDTDRHRAKLPPPFHVKPTRAGSPVRSKPSVAPVSRLVARLTMRIRTHPLAGKRRPRPARPVTVRQGNPLAPSVVNLPRGSPPPAHPLLRRPPLHRGPTRINRQWGHRNPAQAQREVRHQRVRPRVFHVKHMGEGASLLAGRPWARRPEGQGLTRFHVKQPPLPSLTKQEVPLGGHQMPGDRFHVKRTRVGPVGQRLPGKATTLAPQKRSLPQSPPQETSLGPGWGRFHVKQPHPTPRRLADVSQAGPGRGPVGGLFHVKHPGPAVGLR